MSGRNLTLARELTKRHEDYLRLTVTGAIEHYQTREPRGEYVLVLEGSASYGQRQVVGFSETGPAEDPALAMLRTCHTRGLSMKDAVRECTGQSGRKKNEIYQLALSVWQDM
jgi:16S rRNA (cytidine1402-2'-O)-methyltransferase